MPPTKPLISKFFFLPKPIKIPIPAPIAASIEAPPVKGAAANAPAPIPRAVGKALRNALLPATPNADVGTFLCVSSVWSLTLDSGAAEG